MWFFDQSYSPGVQPYWPTESAGDGYEVEVGGTLEMVKEIYRKHSRRTTAEPLCEECEALQARVKDMRATIDGLKVMVAEMVEEEWTCSFKDAHYG